MVLLEGADQGSICSLIGVDYDVVGALLVEAGLMTCHRGSLSIKNNSWESFFAEYELDVEITHGYVDGKKRRYFIRSGVIYPESYAHVADQLKDSTVEAPLLRCRPATRVLVNEVGFLIADSMVECEKEIEKFCSPESVTMAATMAMTTTDTIIGAADTTNNDGASLLTSNSPSVIVHQSVWIFNDM